MKIYDRETGQVREETLSEAYSRFQYESDRFYACMRHWKDLYRYQYNRMKMHGELGPYSLIRRNVYGEREVIDPEACRLALLQKALSTYREYHGIY